MGFSSQSGKVGFKIQTVKGTYKDPGAASPNQGVFVRTRSGSLGGNRDLMIPDPEIGGNRDVPDALLGPISFAGEYDFYARPESMALLLYGALGANTTTGSAGAGYLHTITGGVVNPWVSVEETIANDYINFKYTDMKVNTLHMEADANGYLMGTVGLVGLTQALNGTPTAAPRTDTSPLIVGTNIGVTYNGVTLPAKSFSLDINNNIETDDFRLGSLFLGDAVEKRREMTMGVTIRPNDSQLWRTAMWGTAGATVPGGLTTKAPAVITIASYEDIPGATPGVKYSIVITIPSATIKPFQVVPSGDDVLQHDLEIQALRPDPAVDILTAAVRNSYSTI